MRTLFTFFLTVLYIISIAQDGTLDPTFSFDGKAYATAPGLTQSLSKTFVQSNGRVVIVGRSFNCCNDDFSVARFNADGSTDNSFDGDGVVITDFTPNASDIPRTLVVQPDGKIIAAGSSNQDFALVRYNLDGSLDPTFDGDGKVTTNITGSDEIYALLLLPDGKILAGGTTSDGTSRFAIARYNPNGSLDASFGTGGIAVNTFWSGIHIIYSMARQPDGKIVVAGNVDDDFAIARYTANGVPDVTFDGNGAFLTDFFGNEVAYAVAVQQDGRIIAAGVKDNQVLIMRVLPNGAHDNSLDGDGIIIQSFSSNSDAVYSMVVQGDGKIVLAGTSNSFGFSDFLVVRYHSNGTLDNSFDGDGILRIEMGSSEAYASVMGWNNTLVVGGYSGAQFGVARLANPSYQFVLPVRLKAFTGVLQANSVKLDWTTVSEWNASVFDIERSADGTNFSSIGQVHATGNSSSERGYHYTDHQPIASIGFYRLKITDHDGKVSYSPIIAIRNGKSPGMIVFRNPVQDELRVQVTMPHAGKIRIINAAGAVVREQSVSKGTVSLAIPVHNLPAGIYHILAPSSSWIQTETFMKN